MFNLKMFFNKQIHFLTFSLYKLIYFKNFFKYPTYSETDLDWGLVVTTVGHTHILPNSPYPSLSHPATHQFSNERSRKITDYQIVYITSGEGIFETEKSNRYLVKPGTAFILFPGVLHKYYPQKQSGWTEYYVGLSGNNIDKLTQKEFLSPDRPVFEVGLHESLVNLYNELFEVVEEQMIGYQQKASGIAYHLIGELLHIERNQSVTSFTEELIKNTKLFISERYTEKIDWYELGRQQGVSYSKLRKEFKSYVGISLRQYQIQLRIREAKSLLAQTNEPIKHIALALGFQNEYYFNTLFKRKTGNSPGVYRNKHKGF